MCIFEGAVRRLSVTLLLAALLGTAPAATAAQRPFTTPVRLSGASAGEPSIATDPLGDVFVASPQGVPSVAAGTSGTGLWISHDDGTSFGSGRTLGSLLGGGDDDIIYSKGALYTGDLELAATEICKSTNRGQTFESIGSLPDPAHCSGVGVGQAGPDEDRPWLAADHQGRLYLTYHEFATGFPLAFRSDNGGQDLFTNACGSIASNPTVATNALSPGSVLSRPVVDSAGDLYILLATSTLQQTVAALGQGQLQGALSQLYLAVSHDHCKSFTDYTVFDGSKRGVNTVQFGDLFADLAIDGAGNLYALGTGFIGSKPFAPTANNYLFSSSDHGRTWHGPALVGGSGSGHMLPAAVGGPRAGQVAIGYFQTINGVTDPNSLGGKWIYTTAESNNATAAIPAFTYRAVNPGVVYHNGQICNAGLLCGLIPGGPSDRSLLDFTSVALDPQGCPLFTFAGNPGGTPSTNDATNTFNFVTRQQVGCFGATPPHRAHHRHHHRRHHRRRH
jgi:hypothetical protein